MKKIALVLVLATVFAVGAFAEHPGGWGIGGMFQGSFFRWDGGAGFAPGGALSLKAPQLPVYWGISVDGYYGITIGVTGDYYLIDQALVPDINLGWYAGVGGYGSIGIGEDYLSLGAGVRVPVGLSFMPLDFLEFFIDIAPSIGIGVGLGDPISIGLGGGIASDVGFRIWL